MTLRSFAEITNLLERQDAPDAPRPRRVNWCSRCSSSAMMADRARRKVDATPHEAQPGGSLCTSCAPIEFKARIALKIGACNAKEDRDGAAAWLEVQRAGEKRVARGGKGRAEYPFLPEEKLEALPEYGVEIPEAIPPEQSSFWAQFTKGDTGT